MPIIQDNEIDVDAARAFLSASYAGIDLLPNVPVQMTRTVAAEVLGVSLPTVDRMLASGQIRLTRQSVQTYILDNLLANFPVPFGNEPAEPLQPKKESRSKVVLPVAQCAALPLFGDL